MSGTTPVVGKGQTDAVTFTTSHGQLDIGLYQYDCPQVSAVFRKLVESRYYVGAVCSEIKKNNYIRFSPFLPSLVNSSSSSSLDGTVATNNDSTSSSQLNEFLETVVQIQQQERGAAGGGEGSRSTNTSSSVRISSGSSRLMFPASEFNNVLRGTNILDPKRGKKVVSFSPQKQAIDRPGLVLFDTFTTDILITLSRQNLFFLVDAVDDAGSPSSAVGAFSVLPRYALLGEVVRDKETISTTTDVVQRKFSQAALRDVVVARRSGSRELPEKKKSVPCRLIRLKDSIVVPSTTTTTVSTVGSTLQAQYCDIVEQALRVIMVQRRQLTDSRGGAAADCSSPLVVVETSLQQKGASSLYSTNRMNDSEEAMKMHKTTVKQVFWNPEFGKKQGGSTQGFLSSDDEEDDIYSKLMAQRAKAGGRGALKSAQQDLEKELDEVRTRRAAQAQARSDRTRALMLQVADGLPVEGGGGGEGEIEPPENVLFVCKLNPLTTSQGLATCFKSFGNILSCEVIRDRNTNASLQYAFIEFDTSEACERAYGKMDRVLIDDSRIHVDFSQSVSKLYFDRKQKNKTPGGIRRTAPARNHVAPLQSQGGFKGPPPSSSSSSLFHQSGGSSSVYKRPRPLDGEDEDYY